VYVEYRIKPNFRALGPRVGKRMPALKAALAAADGAALLRTRDAEGTVEIEVTGVLIQRGNAPVQIRVNDYKLLKNDDLEHKEKKVEKLWQIKRS